MGRQGSRAIDSDMAGYKLGEVVNLRFLVDKDIIPSTRLDAPPPTEDTIHGRGFIIKVTVVGVLADGTIQGSWNA